MAILAIKPKYNSKWSNYFFKIAKVVSEQSKDPKRKVGAIIVKDKRIISTGYNGFPINCCDDEDKYLDKEYKLLHVVHAESNAITQAARFGLNVDDSSIFITLHPCIECAKLIIQAGIKEVYFLHDKIDEVSRDDTIATGWRKHKQEASALLKESGVHVFQVDE